MFNRRGCAEWGGWVKMGGGIRVRGEDGNGARVKMGGKGGGVKIETMSGV
jgi:hypothetical protein